jgi:hypothetical protein
MTIEEIEEILTFLNDEAPQSHSEWLRLRKDILTCMVWLSSHNDEAPNWLVQFAWSMFDRAGKRIESYAAKGEV